MYAYYINPYGIIWRFTLDQFEIITEKELHERKAQGNMMKLIFNPLDEPRVRTRLSAALTIQRVWRCVLYRRNKKKKQQQQQRLHENPSQSQSQQ